MQTVSNIIKSFKTELKDIYPANEIQSIIELVFEYSMNFSKTDLFLKSENELDGNKIATLNSILKRLQREEPVQYIVGECHFYNCLFKVNSNVLIPRPETEELVDWIVKLHKNSENLKILDIGTGSGCIPVSIALHIKNASVYACDISEKALEIARENASLNKATVNFFKLDILNPSDDDTTAYDLIISNPPYVLVSEKDSMKKNVINFEPGLALFVDDNDPLVFYKAIINYSDSHLKSGGNLYFEINEKYGGEVEDLINASGFEEVLIKKDINGKNRIVSAKRI